MAYSQSSELTNIIILNNVTIKFLPQEHKTKKYNKKATPARSGLIIQEIIFIDLNQALVMSSHRPVLLL